MKSAIQAAIVRFLRRRGYVVIGTLRLSEFALERHLAQLFDRHGVSAVLDGTYPIVEGDRKESRDIEFDCVMVPVNIDRAPWRPLVLR